MPKVSVIVPIYNVEKYIERCLRSLFEQTLDDIEYIFVNDCTPDNSMIILEKILKEYPHRMKQVKIINHEQNQGQAGARTSGMKAMSGEYMIHCDPDDWVELNMYEIMYQKAAETNADIISCNISLVYVNSVQVVSKVYLDVNPKESLKKCLYTASLNDKLIKTDIIFLYNIFPYENINFGEDLNVVIRCFFYANKHFHLNISPYYYNKFNENSISSSLSGYYKFEKYIKSNIEQLCQFLTKNSNEEYQLTCNYLKFIGKSPLIGKSKKYRIWCNTWTECHRDILKFPLAKKYRLIIYLCSKSYILLKIYMAYLNYKTSK